MVLCIEWLGDYFIGIHSAAPKFNQNRPPNPQQRLAPCIAVSIWVGDHTARAVVRVVGLPHYLLEKASNPSHCLQKAAARF